MKHTQFKEWLQLSVIDELSDDERQLLDAHLRDCSECQAELKELQEFQSIIAKQKPTEVNERLLREARRQLHAALLRERMKKSLWEGILNSVQAFVFREYKVALGGIALAALGVFIGYIIFIPPRKAKENMAQHEQQQSTAQQAMQVGDRSESFTQEDTRTSNVHFIDSDASDGVIEFTFDAVTPMHVRGNINDDKVQKVLVRALTNEGNVGVRLRTVSAIASRMPEQKNPDPEVKAALISAMTRDENPGVRGEALKVLLQYPFDKEIKQGLMYTLTHDKNSGMRIAAINGLAAASLEGQHIDQGILNILKQKVASDNNNYVRRQARTVVEEVSQR